VAEDATLDDCVHAALIVVGTAVRRHAVISLDLTAGRPASLMRAQIIQLIINLVMNAVEAFGERPVSANSIRIATCDHDGVLTLCIEDNGPGVAPADRSLIFTPFHTTKAEGTGLGLAIAARIVADHRGSITCDASPDLGGARFVVMLREWSGQTVEAAP
jgi:C4-dicarboxylate-specific signal transduction histidine kinase